MPCTCGCGCDSGGQTKTATSATMVDIVSDAEEKKLPSIAREMDRLNRLLDQLEKVVAAHIEKIIPILSQGPTCGSDEASAKVTESHSAAVAQFLQTMNSRVYQAISRIQDSTNRVEI